MLARKVLKGNINIQTISYLENPSVHLIGWEHGLGGQHAHPLGAGKYTNGGFTLHGISIDGPLWGLIAVG